MGRFSLLFLEFWGFGEDTKSLFFGGVSWFLPENKDSVVPEAFGGGGSILNFCMSIWGQLPQPCLPPPFPILTLTSG